MSFELADFPMLSVVPFHVMIGVTLLVDALTLGFFVWAFHSKTLRKYRIREPMPVKVPRASYWRNVASNGVLSVVLTLGLIYGLADVVLYASPERGWVIALQAVGIFVAYDFLYYAMHRFVFHNVKMMRFVHGVHHRARYPSALESLYLSPLELLAGLSLLMFCTWLVGPVHYLAFAPVFFVYSTLNIVIHSGLIFPHPAFAVVNLLTEKHHVHHMSAFGKNYASLTPLPDLIFGTAARAE